jgi:hypothetical protein
MNRKYFTILTGLLALLLMVIGAGAQEAGGPITTDAAVYRASDGSAIENSGSRLIRFDNGVTATISTSDLETESVYTVWWVVFNEPQNCNNGMCSMDDIFILNEDGSIQRDDAGNRVLNMEAIEAAAISVQHAGGNYSLDGSLTTSASLGLGSVPGIVFGPGLLDAHKAEVHLVVRTHGATIDGLYHEQLSTFGGGCEPMDAAPCDDVQYTIHLPS